MGRTLGVFRAMKPKADAGALYVYRSLDVNTQSKYCILVPAQHLPRKAANIGNDLQGGDLALLLSSHANLKPL